MTISRRHHRPNQPPLGAKRTAPTLELITVEGTSAVRAHKRDCEISRGQLARFELMIFKEPLPQLSARLMSDPRLKRLWLLIEEQYADPELTLNRAAKASGLCANRLNAILRKKAGLTFHQMLVRYRLLRAREMVAAGSRNTLEVALDAGFGSLSAFERNFRRIFGLPPGQFRKCALPRREC
jgi:AraC-like DNA-binding protein